MNDAPEGLTEAQIDLVCKQVSEGIHAAPDDPLPYEFNEGEMIPKRVWVATIAELAEAHAALHMASVLVQAGRYEDAVEMMRAARPDNEPAERGEEVR